MLSSDQLQAGLAHFTGSQSWFRYRLGEVVLAYYTDGVQYLSDNAECYWLLGEVVGHQPQLSDQPFQVWTLQVNPDRSAQLTVGDGNDGVLLTKPIEFTDFPLSQIDIWVEYGEMEGHLKPILLLPSEH